MGPTVVREYEATHAGTHVESVMIIRTRAEAYPSGWKYSLHYGEIGGETLLRYDNAHELVNGHECHTPDGTESIDFPGMGRSISGSAGRSRNSHRKLPTAKAVGFHHGLPL